MRSTMYTIPDNPDMKKQTGVPFGLVLSPMAEVLPGEYPPPIVNLGELGMFYYLLYIGFNALQLCYRC